MLYSRSRTRHRLARRLSWLVIASLTSVALFAPGTMSVSAASVAPIYLTADIDGDGKNDSNPTCADLDGLYGGSQTWAELEKINRDAGQRYAIGTITVSGVVDGQTLQLESTVGIDAVLVKAGSDETTPSTSSADGVAESPAARA